jgi:hypothetical protein
MKIILIVFLILISLILNTENTEDKEALRKAMLGDHRIIYDQEEAPKLSKSKSEVQELIEQKEKQILKKEKEIEILKSEIAQLKKQDQTSDSDSSEGNYYPEISNHENEESTLSQELKLTRERRINAENELKELYELLNK